MIFNQLIPGELIQNQIAIIVYIKNLYAYQVLNLNKVDIYLLTNANIKGCGSILLTSTQNFSRFLLIYD